MTVLVCWWDDVADGPVNMATDEALALEAERTRSVLVRLYGWTQTTLSLGGFQPVAEARGHPVLAGLPLVRRPSGGGGIIHGSDLTYAVAVPKDHPWGRAPQTLYDAFHGALVAELRGRKVATRLHGGTVVGAAEEAFLCFDRRATGDVVVDSGDAADDTSTGGPGHKILGSAQRRLAGVILQHGSLLWRSNQAVPAGFRHAGLTDLVVSLREGDLGEIARVWLDRVARSLGGGRVDHRGFAEGREAVIARLTARFLDERWTSRR